MLENSIGPDFILGGSVAQQICKFHPHSSNSQRTISLDPGLTLGPEGARRCRLLSLGFVAVHANNRLRVGQALTSASEGVQERLAWCPRFRRK